MNPTRTLTAGFGADELSAAPRDPRVADAIGNVPRHLFVPDERRMAAYLDRAVTVGAGRKCPRPSTVAALVEAADVKPDQDVLVLGDASGYVCAVCAALGARVVLVEPNDSCRRSAAEAFAAADLGHPLIARGATPAHEDRYDAVILCGAVRRIPRRLMSLLRVGGAVVVPLERGVATTLTSFTRRSEGSVRLEHDDIDIAPLTRRLVL